MLLYGLQDQNQLIARKIVTTDHGTTFDAYFDGCFIEKFKIPLYGNHNVLNSLAVIGVCIVQNMNLSQVKNLLQTFPGVKRRFEEVQFHSNILIDDYAHHPKEIEATLGAVKAKYPNQSIISIFQPHSHSRLKHFLFEFTDVLKRSDQVYLCDIYHSKREPVNDISIKKLQRLIPNAIHLDQETWHELLSYKNSVLLFLGGGDVNQYIQIMTREAARI